MTKTARYALAIVDRMERAYDRPVMLKYFAAAMWPDSEGWQRYKKCGKNGVHQGGGMYSAAGGFLGRLARRGLVVWCGDGFYRGYRMTPEGRQAMTS